MNQDKDFNPQHRLDNCGYCSIAAAMDVQGLGSKDADQLYADTIGRLGLTIENGRDPVSRQLIFPEPELSKQKLRPGYFALEGAIGLDNYTITSVADNFKLNYRPSSKGQDPSSEFLPEDFVKFYAERESGNWNINHFIEFRRERNEEQNRIVPSVAQLRHYLTMSLMGDSIVGAKRIAHFLTMRVNPNFEVSAWDPQDRKSYDAKGLLHRMGSVDLVMHLK